MLGLLAAHMPMLSLRDARDAGKTPCIEDPVLIKKILNHLKEKVALLKFNALPESRAPPLTSLFD